MLFGCCAPHAQSATTTSGLGATSPLGMLGSSGATGSGTGIPLGATEIDPGGLSPVSSSCNSGMTSMSGTSSIFDGGGSNSTGSASSTSSCTSSNNVTSAGTASPLSMPGTSSGLTLNGRTIPLGATEIGSAG